MGGCIASALTDRSAVEVVGAVLGLTVQEQEELWRRWRHGESLRLIARRMGKRGPSVRAFVLQTGGLQQRSPRRAARSLSMAEREEISRGVAAGQPCRQIAARLGRAPSTVSRGTGPQRRPRSLPGPGRRCCRLPTCPAAQAGQVGGRAAAAGGGGGQTGIALVTGADHRVAAAGLSPGSGDAGVARDDLPVAVVQRRGALRLHHYLRTGRAMRYPRGTRLPQGRGRLRDTLHISQRPAEASDRAVPGHWEGDLVFGRRASAVGVPNEGPSARRDRARRGRQGLVSHPLPAVTLPNENGPAVPGQTDRRPRSLTGARGRVSCALTTLIDAVRASPRAFDPPGIVPRLIQLAESGA
jgi:DNA-binding CsgD family transcriptional regulator